MSRCPRCGLERPEATALPEPISIAAQAPPDAMPAAPNALAPVMTVPLTSGNAPPQVAAPPIAAPTNTLPFRANAWSAESQSAAPQSIALPRTSVVPMEGQRRRALMIDEAAVAPPPDSIYMSPPDEVRRFPLFTPAQWKLLLAGLFLLALGSLLGYLVWSREKHDSGGVVITPNAAGQANAADQSLLPLASPTVDLSVSPTPELAPMVEGDQSLYAEVKKVLSAYNPIYHTRYQVAVKEGVVTITGPADNQPEKDGVSNVVKMVAGVKDFKNNLAVKADALASAAGLPATNVASNQTTSPTATPTTENNLANQQAALEAERQRLAREAETQRQREAEFQRFREEEQTRRQGDKGSDSSERPRIAAPVESAPAPVVATTPTAPRALRSGTVAWSGIVDGVDEIIITGGSASVRHRSGEAIREPRASFSTAVPRAPVVVKLLNQIGRGDIVVIQEPSATNGYTTIVRIDDTRENGGKPYQFTLRWTAE